MAFNFEHPYPIESEYATPVAYFSMEFALDQALKIYSGGLGFLAGSHMRSAYELKQNMVGIGILWKQGYYDQVREKDQSMGVLFSEKQYSFLEETGIKFQIRIETQDVWVTAYYLAPSVFQTAPMFFLSTDLEENDYLARSTVDKLYDDVREAKVGASILLGLGGARLFDFLEWQPEIYHLNESHGLPLAFHLYKKYGDIEEVRKRLVFTNHTPEEAGNPREDFELLEVMSFFDGLPVNEVREIVQTEDYRLNYTLSALRMAGITNGVSKMHGDTLRDMWKDFPGISPIISITNAQDYSYWADQALYDSLDAKDWQMWQNRKRAAKEALFKEVANQSGDLLDADILTIVFARRFAEYKRADLLLHDLARFEKMVTHKDFPVQVIWAGKPYPLDQGAVDRFNRIVHICKQFSNCTVLTGYELELSKLLKGGADVWLNHPRMRREASGTSGMTAAMNGAINVSIPDGWVPEFARDKENSFVISPGAVSLPNYERDAMEAENLYELLENEVIPTYYEKKADWLRMVNNSMREVVPRFDSRRMADEYYKKMYARVSISLIV